MKVFIISQQLLPIKEHDDYFIDCSLNIISQKRGKRYVMTQPINRSGYKRVRLCTNGKMKMVYVHRLIASEFIPNPENKPCINHINGIKTDNRVENLEWCTYSENTQHALKAGLFNSAKGEDVGGSKLKNIDIPKIRELLNKGESLRVVGVKYGVDRATIGDIKAGRTWCHIKE